MATLKDVMIYVIKNYPNKKEISNARLTKMIYLADWHQAINHNSQITSIDWYFDNYGPFVWDIDKEAKANPSVFCIKPELNAFGANKTVYDLKNQNLEANLTKEEKDSIDHVIEETSDLSWRKFINLVYSTFPIISSEKYSYLNLVEMAKAYTEPSEY